MREHTALMTVRHGDTDFNHQKRYAGLLDVPLNEKGTRDAKLAAQRLELPFDVVVSSTLRRATETAQCFVAGTQEFIQCELCNERDFGKMQGLTSAEVEGLTPVVKYVRIGGDFHSLNPPSGETFPALRRRAKGFAQYVMDEFAGSNVLIVSHEVFLLQLHGILRGETWQEAMRHRLPNLTLTTFTLQRGRAKCEASTPLVPGDQEDGSFFSSPPSSGGSQVQLPVAGCEPCTAD
jgi:broad specificity phosphatase PhoE